MAGGGWGAPYNYDARIIHYETTDNGASWERSLIYRGAGTHEATMLDADGDEPSHARILQRTHSWHPSRR